MLVAMSQGPAEGVCLEEHNYADMCVLSHLLLSCGVLKIIALAVTYSDAGATFAFHLDLLTRSAQQGLIGQSAFSCPEEYFDHAEC